MSEPRSLVAKVVALVDDHFSEKRALKAQVKTGRPSNGARQRWLPSPGSVIFTLLMIGLLLWAQTAGAIPLPGYLNAPDAPSTGTIAYQGRLADANGNPLTSTVNMEFRLYNTASGGTPLWGELWTGSNAVQVSDGLFNVMLGSLEPIPQNIMTGNNSLWLGITAGTDDEMTPRVQLGSVPFAVQALTVPDGSLTTEKIADGGVESSNLRLASGTVCMNNTEEFTLPGGWEQVDVPNLSITLSIPQPSKVLIWSDGLARYNVAGAVLYFHMLVDGTIKASSHSSDSTSWFNISDQRILSLEPGTHTVKAALVSNHPGIAQVHGFDGWNTCLNYLVLGAQQ